MACLPYNEFSRRLKHFLGIVRDKVDWCVRLCKLMNAQVKKMMVAFNELKEKVEQFETEINDYIQSVINDINTQIQEIINNFNDKVSDLEEQINNKLDELEDKVNEKLDELEQEVDDKISQVEGETSNSSSDGGYYRDPLTGFTIMWGRGVPGGTTYFPRAFTTCYVVIFSPNGGGSNDNDSDMTHWATSWTNTSWTNAFNTTDGIQYIAIGVS